jgi:Aerotolerance regulator N-terminal
VCARSDFLFAIWIPPRHAPAHMDFVTPQWLLAAGAVALPVVLHLIRSDRFQRCELATVHLLAAVLRKRGGRRRIENWPLLLVRAAALVALALLLARPFRDSSAAATAGGAETLVLVDVSGSQARRDPADLRRAIPSLPPDAPVTVARFAEAVEVAPADAVLEPVPGTATDFRHARARGCGAGGESSRGEDRRGL